MLKCIVKINLHQTKPNYSDAKTLWTSQIAKFMGPTWGPPGSCRPQMGLMLAPWTLLCGIACVVLYTVLDSVKLHYNIYYKTAIPSRHGLPTPNPCTIPLMLTVIKIKSISHRNKALMCSMIYVILMKIWSCVHCLIVHIVVANRDYVPFLLLSPYNPGVKIQNITNQNLCVEIYNDQSQMKHTIPHSIYSGTKIPLSSMLS